MLEDTHVLADRSEEVPRQVKLSPFGICVA